MSKNITFAEIYTNFLRATICKVRFDTPQAAQDSLQRERNGGDAEPLQWKGAELRVRLSLERSPTEAAPTAPVLRAAWVPRAQYGVAAAGRPQRGRVYGEDGAVLATRQAQSMALTQEGLLRAGIFQPAWEEALLAAASR